MRNRPTFHQVFICVTAHTLKQRLVFIHSSLLDIGTKLLNCFNMECFVHIGPRQQILQMHDLCNIAYSGPTWYRIKSAKRMRVVAVLFASLLPHPELLRHQRLIYGYFRHRRPPHPCRPNGHPERIQKESLHEI